ncbi:MAG TPA: carbohydrate porin, partial [Rhodocyclaceae bacterium]|nr:carbohydrate porin [Rhodocyclaceae bacterium]
SGSGARFDRALTAGAEIAGFAWGRGADSLGLGGGLLAASRDFRAASATVDADGNGIPDYGYVAGGNERLLELYYRWRFNKQFEISPDLQFIGNPAGNGGAPAYRVFSLRAQITY